MDIQDKLKLNLQFFSEDPDDRTNSDDKQGDNDQDDPKKDDKKDGDDKKNDYVTVEELQRRLKQKDKEKENAVKEAEKLAKMNKDQKNEYEMEKLRKENEELRQREAMNSMRNEARSMFSEKNITATDDLLDIVVTTEAESTQKNIDAITEIVNDIAQERLKELLRTGSPKNIKSGGMTREDIMNIKDSDERQMAIYQNRHLFK
ncbi:DUF4355 domain-containing protein [Staphylococcus hominis]|uniref:DUF4355 domain-containing protein n=1 Tax=Staphylococcus hominis TaxID=1290 RepID=UPI0012DF4EA5|nr:DUF4355 domain-containing protein [Staphylococcus hominis]MCI2896248.1 DUF4355 domain-containing protein [Staphylococcus hominis]MDS3901070.1 DUF4355 domain-containing protein [Staphylococcus hominis]QGR78823.1 DUF4355 domain-containing protein [Staphylococcus hominis]